MDKYIDQPSIEWDAHLRVYAIEVVLETGRETLVFSALKEAQDYRNAYVADQRLVAEGKQPIFNSGFAA